MFFVISGYLITKIIAADVERKTFSILDFYDRRLRRILPALVVVYLASALGALAVLYPKDLVDFGKSLAASAGFVSNLYFDATSGYFSGAAEEKALLHTWSLSVEEQFYIFWPLLLLWALTRKRGSGVAIGMGALISVLSLGYAQHQLHADPQSAFYLLPSRAWELLLGALLPLTRHHRPVLPAGLAQGMGALGLVCILAPYTYLHASSPFPGIAALPSCLGAALVLWSGENHDTLVGRILSLKPLTFVGLISYSLYLWHWPLLALALARKGNPLALSESLLWVVLALLGAVFSWKYVEQPFRKKGRYAIATVLRVGVATLVLSGLAGGSLALLDGIPARFDAETRARLAMEDDGWDDTESVGPETLEFADFLHVNADDRYMGVTTRTRIDVLLLGDSHAMSIESSLSDVLKQHDLVGRAFVQTACPALIGVTRYADGTEARCGPLRRWLEQVTSGSVPPAWWCWSVAGVCIRIPRVLRERA